MQGLVNIETKILAIFRRLCALEISGRKSDKKYMDIEADLRKKIANEENLLQNSKFNLFSASEALEKLTKIEQLDESVRLRLLSRIVDILISEQIKANVEVKPIDSVLKEAQNNICMFQAKFIRDFILEEKDEDIKKALIANYYEMCYLHPKLSELFLDDDFDLTKDCFNSCYLIADTYRMSRKEAKKIIDDYCAELLMREIGRIFFDERFSNPESVGFNQKMATSTFRGLESMLSKEGYEKAHDAILYSIEEHNLKEHPNYDFVISLFSNPNRPKGSARTITLGKPLN